MKSISGKSKKDSKRIMHTQANDAITTVEHSPSKFLADLTNELTIMAMGILQFNVDAPPYYMFFKVPL